MPGSPTNGPRIHPLRGSATLAPVTLWLLKLVLAPALVVSASMAGRRWGIAVSGLLVGLPVVAGPVLLVTAVQHGARFGTHAAQASLLGLVSLCVFLVVFAHLTRARVLVALLVAWAACVVADVCLAQLPSVATGVAFLLAVVAAGLAYAALPGHGVIDELSGPER